MHPSLLHPIAALRRHRDSAARDLLLYSADRAKRELKSLRFMTRVPGDFLFLAAVYDTVIEDWDGLHSTAERIWREYPDYNPTLRFTSLHDGAYDDFGNDDHGNLIGKIHQVHFRREVLASMENFVYRYPHFDFEDSDMSSLFDTQGMSRKAIEDYLHKDY